MKGIRYTMQESGAEKYNIKVMADCLSAERSAIQNEKAGFLSGPGDPGGKSR